MKIKLKGIANVKSFLNIFSGKDKTQQQHTEYFAQRSGKGTNKAAENSRKRFRTSKPKRQQKHIQQRCRKGSVGRRQGG